MVKSVTLFALPAVTDPCFCIGIRVQIDVLLIAGRTALVKAYF
jgi:hypothetical protein